MDLGRTCSVVLALGGAWLAALWVAPQEIVGLLVRAGSTRAAGSPALSATVALRLDDVTSRSAIGLEADFVAELRASRLAATVAVVPFGFFPPQARAGSSGKAGIGLGGETLELLRGGLREGQLEVALHGRSHRPGLVRHSEFVGLPAPEQALRIAEGQRFLERELGAPIRVFVPPWNSYDENTLRALTELGFSAVSATANGASPPTSTLRFLPATARLRNLRRAVEHARSLADREALVVVLIHPPELAGASAPLRLRPEALDALRWLGAQADVEVRTLGAAADSLADLGPAHLATFRELGRAARARFVPPPLARAYAELLLVYPSRETLARLAGVLRLLVVLHYTAAAAGIGAGAGLVWAWRRSDVPRSLRTLG